ncbi:hypothetical protein DCC62_03575 [candidate division KSB1 bacterium]|nr:MAG: hypothetical protein DCC62_03575 [candidate division KSB1 bacterium]
MGELCTGLRLSINYLSRLGSILLWPMNLFNPLNTRNTAKDFALFRGTSLMCPSRVNHFKKRRTRSF